MDETQQKGLMTPVDTTTHVSDPPVRAHRTVLACLALFSLCALASQTSAAQTATAAVSSTPATAEPPAEPTAAPVAALPFLDVARYLGTWFQVAWFPNRFQRQCVSDTQARYRQLPAATIEVLNQCRLADGKINQALGLARPAGSRLQGKNLEPA